MHRAISPAPNVLGRLPNQLVSLPGLDETNLQSVFCSSFTDHRLCPRHRRLDQGVGDLVKADQSDFSPGNLELGHSVS